MSTILDQSVVTIHFSFMQTSWLNRLSHPGQTSYLSDLLGIMLVSPNRELESIAGFLNFSTLL